MLLEYDLFLPLERVCGLIVGGDEVIHVFAELTRAGVECPAKPVNTSVTNRPCQLAFDYLHISLRHDEIIPGQ